LTNKFKKKYFQGVIIVLLIILSGIVLEIITKGVGVVMPQWPFNIIILFVFVLYIVLLHFFWKSEFKIWLSSIPSTITAISAYSFLAIFINLHAFNSWFSYSSQN